MSRARIRLSTSEEDREIQRLCDEASRKIRQAVDVANSVRGERTDRSKYARRVSRDLNALIQGLNSVARIDSPYRTASEELSDQSETT